VNIKNIKTLSIFLALLLVLPAAAVSGQGNDFVEAWFLYEQGKAKLEDPGEAELGEALLLFQEAIEKRGGTFPEAEMAVGDIYFREGAFALAKRQYEKAYELRTNMEVAADKYTVLYRLSELHEIQELYADMQEYLLAVLEDQPYFSEQRYRSFRDAFLSTYFEKGVDHLFMLYRMYGVAFAAPAHTKLGWFYYRSGLYSPSAVTQCLYALDIVISDVVEEIRRVQPEFVFSTVRDFLDTAFERDYLGQYILDSRFFQNLYYLAAATYAASYPGLANTIWRLLANYPLDREAAADESSLIYVQLARRQLQSPWIDPYLNPSPRRIEYPER
jgi:tetratricopeptide (TPR) repeat protein